jgi:four helix bundle protein
MSTSYKDLKAWQRSMDLVLLVDSATKDFPRAETYGLTSQMRRAAVSIPANMAEGRGRSTDRDFAYFLHHSRGSVHELETLAMIALRLSYLARLDYERMSEEIDAIGRMLNGLINAVAPAPRDTPG